MRRRKGRVLDAQVFSNCTGLLLFLHRLVQFTVNTTDKEIGQVKRGTVHCNAWRHHIHTTLMLPHNNTRTAYRLSETCNLPASSICVSFSRNVLVSASTCANSSCSFLFNSCNNSLNI